MQIQDFLYDFQILCYHTNWLKVLLQQNEQVVATTLNCVCQSQFVVENAIYCKSLEKWTLGKLR